ncbi:MAG: hypothetical protein KAJ70_01105 [Candidatus Omnitrophica bacterium]|nr:hypothetical protein [Candidatus Omnitrophota bacterium]
MVGNSDPKFAGLATQVIWDNVDKKIISERSGNKEYLSELGQAGATLPERVNKDEDFLRHPDARRLLKTFGELAQQVQDYFDGHAQELEMALTYDEEQKLWTIHILQTSFLEPARKDSYWAMLSRTSSPVNQIQETAASSPGGIDLNPNNSLAKPPAMPGRIAKAMP